MSGQAARPRAKTKSSSRWAASSGMGLASLSRGSATCERRPKSRPLSDKRAQCRPGQRAPRAPSPLPGPHDDGDCCPSLEQLSGPATSRRCLSGAWARKLINWAKKPERCAPTIRRPATGRTLTRVVAASGVFGRAIRGRSGPESNYCKPRRGGAGQIHTIGPPDGRGRRPPPPPPASMHTNQQRRGNNNSDSDNTNSNKRPNDWPAN